MAHIAVLCPPVSGHLNPMAALGRKLRNRKHRVTVFQIPEMRARVESEGLEFGPLAYSSKEDGTLAHDLAELGRLSGLSAGLHTLDCGRRLAALTCRSAPSALRSAAVDLVLVDDNEPAGGTVAEHLGVPYINVGSIPMLREPDLPPGFAPWGYSGSAPARWRNRVAFAVSDCMLIPIHRVLNKYRRQWNLPPVHRPPDTLSQYAQLTTLIPEMDYPRRVSTPLLHYTGPLVDGDRPFIAFPYDRLNGQPLIYASFGTVLTKREEYFRAVAQACAGLGAQLVISTGGAETIRELPGNPIVVSYAPQLELLARAKLCITHAGLNTVMEAFSLGVPIVAIPIANDQPAVAARVRWTGAGASIELKELLRGGLSPAVRLVWNDPAYSEAALKLKAGVQAAGGAECAADIVEQVLRTVAPATAAAASV